MARWYRVRFPLTRLEPVAADGGGGGGAKQTPRGVRAGIVWNPSQLTSLNYCMLFHLLFEWFCSSPATDVRLLCDSNQVLPTPTTKATPWLCLVLPIAGAIPPPQFQVPNRVRILPVTQPHDAREPLQLRASLEYPDGNQVCPHPYQDVMQADPASDLGPQIARVGWAVWERTGVGVGVTKLGSLYRYKCDLHPR